MSWVGVAVGGASLIGGFIGSDASQEAAAEQAAAANRALDISSNEFNTITGQESPFLQSGYGSLGELNYLLGIGAPGHRDGATPTATRARCGVGPERCRSAPRPPARARTRRSAAAAPRSSPSYPE